MRNVSSWRFDLNMIKGKLKEESFLYKLSSNWKEKNINELSKENLFNLNDILELNPLKIKEFSGGRISKQDSFDLFSVSSLAKIFSNNSIKKFCE